MSFSASAPGQVSAARDSLVACAAWTAYVGSGNETSRIHYPSEEGGSATLPLAVIEPVTGGHDAPIVHGSRGLPTGTLDITIIGADGDTPDVLEKLAADLVEDLSEQETGLPIRGATYELAGESPFGRNDTSAAITITVEYGLN